MLPLPLLRKPISRASGDPAPSFVASIMMVMHALLVLLCLLERYHLCRSRLNA
uniref:Uncharacterized protein n=1 Tax=Arundo donax TaxID=35708 RepID=A0A0A9GR40_ARUDO